jgi:hypothetical protein
MALSKLPTSELGRESSDVGLAPWGALINEEEYAPDWQWPNSIKMADRMTTDAQVRGLLLGFFLPLRRFRWAIDPNGASAAHVQNLSNDFQLPIKGDDTLPKRARNSQAFSHAHHLAESLLGLKYGHYGFETVGEVREDGLWHLVKCAPRPPRTIMAVNVNQDGTLHGVQQSTGMQQPEITADRLLWYVWDKEGSNWYGRSVLRSIYRNWLLKDRLVRVDAINHERAGAGVPIIEAPPGATHDDIVDLAQLAQSMKVGEEAGGAIPSGSKFQVGTGSTTDVVKSIEMHNEEMARSFLMMFIQLGQTHSGSRALGDTFVEFFNYSQEAVGDWHADEFNKLLERETDFNYGISENAPLLVYERNNEEELTAEDFSALVKDGVIHNDLETENWFRRRYKMPMRTEELPTPPDPETPPAPEGVPQGAADPVSPAAGSGEGRRRIVRAEVALDAPSLPLPPRELRRQPFVHEIRAAVDFADLDYRGRVLTDETVETINERKLVQLDIIHDRIVEAGNDIAKLNALTVPPAQYQPLNRAMSKAAGNGMSSAAAEAKAQGVEPKSPTTSALNELDLAINSQAKALDEMMANGLADAAKRQALQRVGPTSALTPKQVADAVKEHLGQLSDAWLKEQVGGALHQSMGAGRKAVMMQNKPTHLYASELLDERTCTPCADVDGTEYNSMAEAFTDYPGGGFVGCDGDVNCRGTLVATYGSEEEPSVEELPEVSPDEKPPAPETEAPQYANPTRDAKPVYSGGKDVLTSYEEEQSLKAYCDYTYTDINRQLRMGEENNMGGHIKSIDDYFENSAPSLDRPAYVSRNPGRRDHGLKIGDTFNDKAYFSTSWKLDGVGARGTQEFQVTIPTGTKIADANALGVTRFAVENEIILPRNTNFKVVDIKTYKAGEKDNNGNFLSEDKTVYIMEALPYAGPE